MKKMISIIIMVLLLLKINSSIFAQNNIQIVNDKYDSIYQVHLFKEIVLKITDTSLYVGVFNKKTNGIKLTKVENREVIIKSEPFLQSNFEIFSYCFFSNQKSVFLMSEPEMFIHFVVKNKKIIFFINFSFFNPCEDKIDSDLMFVEVMYLYELTKSLRDSFNNLKK